MHRFILNCTWNVFLFFTKMYHMEERPFSINYFSTFCFWTIIKYDNIRQGCNAFWFKSIQQFVYIYSTMYFNISKSNSDTQNNKMFNSNLVKKWTKNWCDRDNSNINGNANMISFFIRILINRSTGCMFYALRLYIAKYK